MGVTIGVRTLESKTKGFSYKDKDHIKH